MSLLWQHLQVVWEWVRMTFSHLALLAAAAFPPSLLPSLHHDPLFPSLLYLEKRKEPFKETKGKFHSFILKVKLSSVPFPVWAECLLAVSAHSHLPVPPLIRITEVFRFKGESPWKSTGHA